MVPTVTILSFNSSETIGATLASVRVLSDDIFVVDSGSVDNTVDIALQFGATVLHHPFENYGLQRNWAIDNIRGKYDWHLHLDADERLTPALLAEIAALPENSPYSGFLLPRYLQFMGKLLRHNLAPTFHMRLFRSGKGRCENRKYDQHFICAGPVQTLSSMMVDDIRMPLTEWTRRHNQWADAEVEELLASDREGRVSGKLFGNAIEKKRLLRAGYDGLPLFIRPFLLFVYRYLLRGGFLDGIEGLIFCVLQTLWFRFLIDAKLYERKLSKEYQGESAI